MAIRWERQFITDTGAQFSTANFPGAAIRLLESDSSGTTGSLVGNLAEVGNGLWYINFSSGSYISGFFKLQKYTTATGAWADVSGASPFQLNLFEPLLKTGGTLTGNLSLGGNELQSVSNVVFSPGGTIAGIEGQNLLDKTAAETISGSWSCTGDFSMDNPQIQGVPISVSAEKINLLDSVPLGSKIMTTETGASSQTRGTTSTTTILDPTDAGYIPIDSTAGAFTISLPPLSTVAAGAEFQLCVEAGANIVSVVPNPADEGISLANDVSAQAVGKALRLQGVGDCVVLRAPGNNGANAYWLITGGFGVELYV